MADVRIVSIGTAVPSVVLPQDSVRDLLIDQSGTSRLAKRLIGAAMDNAAVRTRYSVIEEFTSLAGVESTAEVEPSRAPRDDTETTPAAAPLFYDAGSGQLIHSSTGTRNAVYVRESTPLALRAARRALEQSSLAASDVTHVITVSCTGFFAPGPDIELVRALGLRPTTRRLHVGFMGCYGAFPGLRAAVDACRAEPDAVVLMVCVELCTLHLRNSTEPDTIVSSSLFADGAGAALITARSAAGRGLRVDALHAVLAPDSEHDMTWTLGDLGFEMSLSSYVPRALAASIGEALEPLRPPTVSAWPQIEHWAIHPGGRSILDRVQQALGLGDQQLAPARGVLSDYGNMSSATVLFVLERIARAAAPGDRVLATAFGPGLTVESALLTLDES